MGSDTSKAKGGPAGGPLTAASAVSWVGDDTARDNLQLIAEGVTETAGWGVAAIRLVRDQELELVALAGADLSALGSRAPLPTLLAELEVAEHWGVLRFIAHERLPNAIDEGDWVLPEFAVSDAPDAWHPLDMLVAPLYDAEGVLRGTLSIDVPDDGRRPGPERRGMLEKYAVVAGRAVVTAIERERLAAQVAMANTVKSIVRKTSAQLSLIGLLQECEQALVEGFRAAGMWIQAFGETDGQARIYATDGTILELPDEMVKIGEAAAYHCWNEQVVGIIAEGSSAHLLSEDDFDQVLSYIKALGIDSLLFAPLGAGPECLGSLVLTRADHQGAWTDIECAILLDIGQDLGRAILNARTFEREHQLVQELQALDLYKGQLIATVSHELKNPLGAIIGHLEMLESVVDPTSTAQTSLKAMDRGAERMSRVIEDLLLLSKVGDPHHPIIPVDVDLTRIVRDVVELTEFAARAKELTVQIVVPDEPALARGVADELDTVVLNLVSNAVKYTPQGGSVTVTLQPLEDDLVLTVVDDGIGISAADQDHLFNEFFRSENPVAVAQPGTGLGLAIVKRIIERHDGEITVASALGTGSRFAVTLPAPVS